MTPAPNRRDFPDRATLADALAADAAALLQAGITERGAALLIVSGGTTPLAFFDALSRRALDWSRVVITLADERRVSDDNPRSNAGLVRRALLQNAAAGARFVPLADSHLSAEQELAAASARIAALPLPADLVVLGMGADGHTASWFPDAVGLAEAIDPAARALVAPIEAPGAGEPRLTLTGRVILRARKLALHIEGVEKLRVLEEALKAGPVAGMPVRAALREAGERVTIYWAQ